MQPATASASMPAPSGMSEVNRILGIFWDPKPVYRDLAAKPRWWVPMILLMIVSVTMIYTFSHKIGWETFIQKQIEQQMMRNPQMTQPPAEQLQIGIKIAGTMGYVMSVIGGPIFALLIAALLTFVFKTLGGVDVTFKQSFSFTYYSYLPNAIAQILAIVVMFFVIPADFDLNNPVALNVAWFLDPATTPAWLRAPARFLDVFWIWSMLLTALGFSTATKRLKYSKSVALVASVWLVFAAIATGWAAMFG